MRPFPSVLLQHWPPVRTIDYLCAFYHLLLIIISFVDVLDYTSRVDLVQDLRFDIATSKIKATPDGEFLIASGDFKQA